MTFQYGLYTFLFILFVTCNSAEIKSTDFFCANSYAELKCPNNSQIVIQRIVNKYKADECLEFNPHLDNLIENRFDFCLGIVRNDEYSRQACNGEQTCHINLKQYNFKTDISEANCNFTSNYGKFFYSCIPNFETQKYKLNSYDICDNYAPSILEDVDRGFIHSPSYPNYYSNNKDCYIGIKIPSNKRLVVYLVKRSLEEKSIFRNQPNDYVAIEDDVKYYGYSGVPEIIYDGNDREEIYIKFISDWITTQPLRNPKGFLIYFEMFPIHQPVTTKPIAAPSKETTSTFASTATIKSTTEFIKADSREFMPESFSEKIKNDDDVVGIEEQRLTTIVILFMGFVGLSIIAIFGLLFAFRSSIQKKINDRIYDINDSKSVHSGNYNEEYQNVSIISTISLNNETPIKTKKASNKSTFNDRLRKLYKNMNKTLQMSNNLLKNENMTNKNINSTMNLDKTNNYNLNEFNPNESDIKFEKDIPIDKLRLCRISTTSVKKSNLEREQEIEQRKDLNRSENHYVTIPTHGLHFEDSKEDGKLEIYEVNFENNFAYLTPSNKSIENDTKHDETEIYHSINDYGNDCRELLKDQTPKSSQNEENIYSTPCNKELKMQKTNEDTSYGFRNSDNSVVNLLNHENDETNA